MAVPLHTHALRGVSRSVYRSWGPPVELADTVHREWAGAPGWHRTIRIIPDGCVDLVWDGRVLAAVAVGAAPARIALDSDRTRVGIRPRPGVGGALLGVDLAALGTAPVPLAELVGAPARHAEDELAGRADLAGQLAALRALVTRLRRERPGPEPPVVGAVSLLSRPGARVESVAGRLGVSERTLRRRLRPATGLAPKQLHRVLRFGLFARRLGELAEGLTTLAEVASTLGYADQSHLGRDCLRLTGSAPAALVRSWREAENSWPKTSRLGGPR